MFRAQVALHLSKTAGMSPPMPHSVLTFFKEKWGEYARDHYPHCVPGQSCNILQVTHSQTRVTYRGGPNSWGCLLLVIAVIHCSWFLQPSPLFWALSTLRVQEGVYLPPISFHCPSPWHGVALSGTRPGLRQPFPAPQHLSCLGKMPHNTFID